MFTTTCFIRKNTTDLKNKLKEIGYDICPCADFDDAMWLDNCLLTHEPSIHGIGYVDEDYTGRKTSQDELDFFLYENNNSTTPKIDCKDNEELFLALVALQDDNDKNQWFTDGNIWEKNTNDLPSKYMQLNGHKATVEELINHFN